MGLGTVAWQILRFVAVFTLVILLAAGATRWLGRTAGGNQRGMRVLCGLGLGTGKTLVAVQVGQRVLVLALASGRVEVLATITDPEEIALLEGRATPMVRNSGAVIERFRTLWTKETPPHA